MTDLIFSGTPKKIGESHGEALKYQIERTLDIYQNQIWNFASDAPIEFFYHTNQPLVLSKFPHLHEEIEGIAEGSNIALKYIYAINGRTELMSGLSINECTSIGIPPQLKLFSDSVLAQNWDWMEAFNPVVYTVEYKQNEKPNVLTLLEAGMLGKIGMNDEGLGVGLNFLYSPEINPAGLTVHMALREILNQKSYADAHSLLANNPLAASANYLIGDAEGEIKNIEASPSGVVQLETIPLPTHANARLASGEDCQRRQRFAKNIEDFMIQSDETKINPEQLLEALKGVQFQPEGDTNSIATIATTIANLTRRRFTVFRHLNSRKKEVYTFS